MCLTSCAHESGLYQGQMSSVRPGLLGYMCGSPSFLVPSLPPSLSLFILLVFSIDFIRLSSSFVVGTAPNLRRGPCGADCHCREGKQCHPVGDALLWLVSKCPLQSLICAHRNAHGWRFSKVVGSRVCECGSKVWCLG